MVRRADLRERLAREAELLGQTAVGDVALHHHRVDAAALISAIASSFMIRQYGTSVSSARISGKPSARVAVLVVGGELAAEARLAEVEVVQRREGGGAARAAATGSVRTRSGK